MSSRGEEDGAERKIGGPDRHRLAVDGCRPARVERVGKHEVRGHRRVGFDDDVLGKIVTDSGRAGDFGIGGQRPGGIFDDELVAEVGAQFERAPPRLGSGYRRRPGGRPGGLEGARSDSDG